MTLVVDEVGSHEGNFWPMLISNDQTTLLSKRLYRKQSANFVLIFSMQSSCCEEFSRGSIKDVKTVRIPLEVETTKSIQN